MATYNDIYPWSKVEILHNNCVILLLDILNNLRDILECCILDKVVCKYIQANLRDPFCFFYDTLFVKLDIQFPFTTFEKVVLTMLNITSTQLSF